VIVYAVLRLDPRGPPRGIEAVERAAEAEE
jgi:hypothetical protein